MSKHSSQAKLFRALIAKLTPALRRAFLQAVQDLRDGVDMDALLEALAQKDIDAAIAALNIEPAAFHAYSEALKGAYAAGGTLAATTINGPVGANIAFRFDMSNPRAEAWIKKNVAERVIVEAREQVEIVRSIILAGYSDGRHPNSIALDIVGRIQQSKRQGGVLGLDPYRASHRDRMRARLQSSDPRELKKVLSGMSLRDKRYDKYILAAIEDGKPIPDKVVEVMVQRYTDRMLQRRAEDIARTETGSAVMSARKEEWNQALDKLNLPPEAVVKTWRHGGGVKDPRYWHQDLNGTSVIGLDTPFIMPTLVELQYAMDPDGGASECVNCSCGTDFRIDHSIGLT